MTAASLPPSAPAALQLLVADFTAGKNAALARAVSIVENRRPGCDLLLAAMHPLIGRARRIGFTGPPGAGKSTLTTQVALSLRRAGLRVGIVAVDPTSTFTGGALLGDRVRMESIALDPGVFIRSMATRGALGGIAGAAREVCDVLDAFGMDRILVETVGVGQSELAVARAVDSTVVVLVPESGDSIQTLKAGVMEIADLFVVNKADRPGADRLRGDLESMLRLREGFTGDAASSHHGVTLTGAAVRPAQLERVAVPVGEGTWMPPVLRSIGTAGEGIAELVGAVDLHFAYLERAGILEQRRRARLRERVVNVVEERVSGRLWADAATMAWLEERLLDLESGRTNPYAVADALLARSTSLLAGLN